MERHLEQMFKSLNMAYMALESRLKAEGFRMRVLQVFKAWEEWAVYQRDFLIKLKHIFLGTLSVRIFNLLIELQLNNLSLKDEKATAVDIDGAPLSGDEKDDEDLDGVPLDGAALLKSAMMRGLPGTQNTQSPARLGDQTGRLAAARDDSDYDDDIDGIPSECRVLFDNT